jgi:cutinase
MDVIKLGYVKRARRLLVGLSALIVTTWAAVLGAAVPSAFAQPCPDVEVVFARGTDEPPGVGGIGQAFVNTLSSQVGSKSVGAYPVNYSASGDFGAGLDFAKTFIDGIRDAGAHLESTAANCPNTRIVLGGYSQGAALAGFVTSDAIPKEIPTAYAAFIPRPMPPEVANHVAAVTLFGRPSNQWLQSYGAPPITIGPLYAPKTIDLCAPDDTICNGAPGGGPTLGHAAYAVNGMLGQAADFAASRL